MLSLSLMAAAALVVANPAASGFAAAVVQTAASAHPLDEMVERLQRTLPRDFGAGVSIAEARREDQTVVVLIDVPQALLDTIGRQEFADLIAQGFCQSLPAGYFEQGYRLRADSRGPDRRVRQGIVIERCPG